MSTGSTQQQWAQVLAAAARPDSGLDRDALVQVAVGLGLTAAPGVAGCSVTELTGDGYRTTDAAGAVALALDQAQYDAGSGPCLIASSTGREQRLDRADRQSRYPEFAAASRQHGVRSSLSLPLVGVLLPSALNVYASTPDAFGVDRPRAVAGLLARSVALLLQGGGIPAPVTPAVLSAALERRRTVEAAERVLMARHRIGASEAFRRLVERSRVEQRSVVDLARELVPDAAE
jgi:hypothetical protein